MSDDALWLRDLAKMFTWEGKYELGYEGSYVYRIAPDLVEAINSKLISLADKLDNA